MPRILVLVFFISFILSSIILSNPPQLYTFTGSVAWDQFGLSLADAGDVNDDGYQDIIFSSGLGVHVFSGFDGSSLYFFENNLDFVVSSAACAGDVNNDNHADIIAGAGSDPLNNTGGRVLVFSGLNGDTLFNLSAGVSTHEFGWSVATAGDVNNDGYSDIIIGDPGYDIGFLNAGAVYVISGFNGDTLHLFEGVMGWQQIGLSVASAGDLNNDNHADIIIGTTNSDVGSLNAGSAYIYSGIDGSELYVYHGNAVGDNLGSSVASAGDVNNDGFDDIIIGADDVDVSGSYAGAAYVFSGFNGDTIYTFTGAGSWHLMGNSVASAGDVNNDGFSDIIIASSNQSKVYVFSGQNADTLYSLIGDADAVRFGYRVASVGDINHDNYSDFIISDPNSTINGTHTGKVSIFSGNPDSCVFQFPGDVDGSGGINATIADITVADVIYLVAYIYSSGPAPVPMANGDPNGDCLINQADIDYLMALPGGPAPVSCTCVNPVLVTSCYIGTVGDANISGEITGEISVGDITSIVDFLFGTGAALPCLEEADANQSGGVTPIPDDISVGDITSIVDFLFGTGDALPDCL